MLQLLSISNIFRHFHYARMYIILGLTIVFTGLFCLCKDEEFGGMIRLHHHIQDIKNMITESHHAELQRRHSHTTVSSSFSHDSVNGLFAHVFNRFYYVIICTTMLGFGDIYPITLTTRCLTILYVLLIFFVAFF